MSFIVIVSPKDLQDINVIKRITFLSDMILIYLTGGLEVILTFKNSRFIVETIRTWSEDS
jgi:hypothetical protein